MTTRRHVSLLSLDFQFQMYYNYLCLFFVPSKFVLTFEWVLLAHVIIDLWHRYYFILHFPKILQQILFLIRASVILSLCVCRVKDRRRQAGGTDGRAVRAIERRVSGGQRRGVRRICGNGRAARGGPQRHTRRESSAGRTRIRFGTTPGVLPYALYRLFYQVGTPHIYTI